MSDSDTAAPVEATVGSTYSSNDKRQAGKVFTVTAVDEDGGVTLADSTGGKPRSVAADKLAKQYTLIDRARKKPGRPARVINEGSTWKRRSDGAEVKVNSVDKDSGTISVTGPSGKPTTSKLLFFRRRFQHVKG